MAASMTAYSGDEGSGHGCCREVPSTACSSGMYALELSSGATMVSTCAWLRPSLRALHSELNSCRTTRPQHQHAP